MKRSHTIFLLCAALFFFGAPDDGTALAAESDAAPNRQLVAANGFLRRGLNELAIDEYMSFLESRPALEEERLARYGLGVAYARTGRPELAIEQLIRLRGESDFDFHAEALVLLCQSHMAEGAFEDAAKVAEQFNDEHEEHAHRDVVIGMLIESEHRAGQYEGAAEVFERRGSSIENAKALERSAYFAASSHAAMQQHDKVLSILSDSNLSDDGPLISQRCLLMARAHQALGRDDAAAKRFREALLTTNESTRAEARVGLAFIELRMGDARTARSTLQRLETESPARAAEADAQLLIARCLYELGDIDEAASVCDALLADDETSSSDAAYLRARCHVAMDEPEQAAALFAISARASGDESQQARMGYERAVALWKAGSDEEALGVLRDLSADGLDDQLAGDLQFFKASLTTKVEGREAGAVECKRFVEKFEGHPDEAKAWFMLGEHAYFDGRLADAAKCYSKAQNQSSDSSTSQDALFRLGLVRADLGEDEAAAELLEALVNEGELIDAHASALETLGDLATDDDDWDMARRWYERRLDMPADAADEARVRLKLGLALVRGDRPDAAMDQFESVLQSEADQQDQRHALFEIGQIHLARESYDEAQNAFMTIMEKAPESEFAPFARRHLATIALAEGDFESADTLLQGFEEASSESAAQVDFDRAQALTALGEHAKAQEALERALGGDLDDRSAAGAKAQLVLAMARQGQQRDAMRAFDRITERDWAVMDPTIQHSVRLEHASLLRASGDDRHAREALLRQLGDAPPADLRPYVALELADLLAAAEEHEEAAAIMEDLLGSESAREDALSPDLRAQALYQLATCQYALARHDDAAKNFDAYIELEPESPVLESALHLSGESHLLSGRPELAADRLSRVVDEFDDSSRSSAALLRLGQALATLQRWDDSERAMMRHRRAHPDDALWFQAQFGIGWAREQMGRFSEAIEAYAPVASEHDGETAARAQFQIGECLYAQNQYDKAVGEFMKVDILFAYPQWSAAALYEAGRCLEATNDMDKARESYERAIEIGAGLEWARMADARLEALKPTPVPGR